MKIKSKRGRPTKFSSRVNDRAKEYTDGCVENDSYPTIEGLAVHLGVGSRTLYDWEAEYPEFSQTMESVRDTQRQVLITKGLEGKYNARLVMFLLRATHGYKENEPLVNATQNNSFGNVSPELLADAITIMRERKGNQ